MISFTVPGKPMAKGSKIAVMPKGHKRPIIIDSNKKAAGWQAHVTDLAAAVAPSEPITGPVSVSVVFYFSRPKKHFHTGKKSHVLRNPCPFYHQSKPDADKLMRTLGDGITNGGIWRDDSQVASLSIEKRYGTTERTEVEIKTL